MNLLFDLNHPAHFHLFKNTILNLNTKGHKVFITARRKDILTDLLQYAEWDYVKLKKNNCKVCSHFANLHQLRKFYKSEKIDLAIGVSALIAQAALFSKTKSLVFDDDDIMVTPIFALMAHSFASHVLSPSVLQIERNGKKDVFHHSLHELAYLHPSIFTPSQSVLNEYSLKNDDYLSIVRLSALQAHHDIGEKGISSEQSLRILEKLKSKGRVLISSEKELPAILKPYALKNPEHFHHLLAFAGILVCDSQTVASEAAVLGIPSVRINTFVGRISYLEELEHTYQLTFGFKPHNFDSALKKIDKIIDQPDSRIFFQQKREKLLSEKIDLTAFMVWFIENYPESAKIMKENPDYQYRFK